jgi:hypothetical protein
MTPRILLGPGLVLEASLPARSSRDGLALSPLMRVSGATAAAGALGTAAERASFRWTGARLDVCPARLGLGPLETWGCARGEAGALRGTGSGVETPGSPSDPWLAVGAVALLRWVLFGRVSVEISTSATLPLLRDHFYFDNPASTLYDTPVVVGEASAALGARFW